MLKIDALKIGPVTSPGYQIGIVGIIVGRLGLSQLLQLLVRWCVSLDILEESIPGVGTVHSEMSSRRLTLLHHPSPTTTRVAIDRQHDTAA